MKEDKTMFNNKKEQTINIKSDIPNEITLKQEPTTTIPLSVYESLKADSEKLKSVNEELDKWRKGEISTWKRLVDCFRQCGYTEEDFEDFLKGESKITSCEPLNPFSQDPLVARLGIVITFRRRRMR